MKNCKALYEAQIASRLKEKIQHLSRSLPHWIKPYYVSGKYFLMEIYRKTEKYRHLLSKCFKSAVLGCQEMVQCKCFCWNQAETCLLGNLQSQNLLREHIIFNFKRVEVRKMSGVFWAKPHCKMSDLFQ